MGGNGRRRSNYSHFGQHRKGGGTVQGIGVTQWWGVTRREDPGMTPATEPDPGGKTAIFFFGIPRCHPITNSLPL